jgi:DNA polymerase elongation subunit (family B)
MAATTRDLVIHILDIQARDIRIESETEEVREVVYESADEEGSDGEEGGARKRAKRAAPAKREFLLHLFGATADGHCVRMDAEGFRPTLYLRLPESKTRDAIESLRTYMTTQGIPLSQLTLKQVMKRKFYGFTANKEYPFLEITTPSLSLWRNIKNLFLDDTLRPHTKRPLAPPYKSGEIPEVYEANFDPMLRFFHVQGLNPCGWLKVSNGLDLVEDLTAPQWTLTTHYSEILPCMAPMPSAPFLEASWDIECYSATGDFPVPSKTWTEFAEQILDKKVDVATALQAYTTLLKPARVFDRLAQPAVKAKLPTLDTGEELGLYLKKQIGEWVVLGDPVIQIGTTLSRNGVPFERHLFVFPDCAPIDDIVVHAFPTEARMIEGYFAWLVSVNPDTLMGYNVFGFDEKYLWKRAEELGCATATSAVHGLSRLLDTGAEVKLEEKRLSSSALGDNFLYMWTTAGRLQVDMFQYIKRSASLPSYKLDEVTKHYLSGKLKRTKREVGTGPGGKDLLVLELSGAVKDLRAGRALCLLDETGDSLTDKMVIVEVRSPGVVALAWPILNDDEVDEEDLRDAGKWVVVKDDVGPQDIFRLHRGDAADRAIVGKYCLQDCDLVLELYRKLEVFNNSMSMANVCCVPISYIFTRGQGVKIESLMFRACREKNTLIPVLAAPRPGGEEDSYEGAIVLDPVPGFYSQSPIGVADFASLYPSTIESENISHDSLVWTRDFNYEGRLIGSVYESGYDEANASRDGFAFTDIEFDIWRPDPADKRKHPEKKKCGLRICRYAQPLDGSKSTLPEIIRGLLAARKAKRVEGERETDAGRKALLDAEQLAYKLTANSLYGQLGSGTFKIRLQALAASVTAYGRKQILFAKAVIERFYGGGATALGGRVKCDVRCEAKVVYGDSVTGDTPLLLKNEKGFFVQEIQGIIPEADWLSWRGGEKEAVTPLCLSTWSEKGWTKVLRVIRHKLCPSKKLYRITTGAGSVDVTSDHSLLLANGNEICPKDVTIGTPLLHHTFPTDTLKGVVGSASRKLLDLHRALLLETKEGIDEKEWCIQSIEELPHPGPDAYVYDLETENHHFAVGPGALVVHNTDSLFVEFNPVDAATGERLTGREARQAVIDLTAEAGHLVTQALAPPHDFEFDKVFDPMLMFSKKRYAGCMYENNADDYVYKYMGIALKRRDNAPVVKAIFGKAMKKLLNERDIAGATGLVQQMSMDLVQGKTSLGQLTITKSLRAEYADASRIAHKALADRMAIRDPGNAPASGDRIPYVYIRPAIGAEAAKLQGDRIETPSYVREKGLVPDYEFYLEHQIQNPVSQMFGLLLEGMPGFVPDMLRTAPTEPERLLAFRETVAADILFRKAYEACRGDKKRAFVTKFFGTVEAKAIAKPTLAPKAPSMMRGSTPKAAIGAATGGAGAARAVQATLSGFGSMSNSVRDGFLVAHLTKQALQTKPKVVAAPKPDIVAQPTGGSLVSDAMLMEAFKKRKGGAKGKAKGTAGAAAAEASDEDEET